MAYLLGPDVSHPDPALKRLDHIICHVPDIERFHSHFRDELGFPEAWPIGPFWPEARTSGIALGGINLEFIQPDSNPPSQAAADTLVFEPTTVDAAERGFANLGVATKRFDKIEPNPELLALRGFHGERLESPQLICQNLLLESEFPVPMFLCDYSPELKDRLSPDHPRLKTPYGSVLSLTLQLREAADIWKLANLGYLGKIELYQTEGSFGEPRITEIKLETGPLDLKGLDPGFRFV